MVPYSAYCIAPFFPSWLGSGTSLRSLPVMLFMGGGGSGPPFTSPGFIISGAAGLEEELEMKAAEPARGMRAVEGFMAPLF